MKLSPTITVARGFQWSRGENTPDMEGIDGKKVYEAILSAFYDIVGRDNSITWCPNTSEVIAEVDEEIGIDLDEARKQARERVFERVEKGEFDRQHTARRE